MPNFWPRGTPGGEKARQGGQDQDDTQPEQGAVGGKGVAQGRFRQGHANGVAEEFANRQGQNGPNQPTEHPNEETLDHENLQNGTVRCANRPHDPNLAGSFEHVDAHGAHQP